MEYRHLGNSGLRISSVGLGTNNFARNCDFNQAQAIVDAAIGCGVTFFDTADVYPHPTVPGTQGMSEEFLGKAIGKRRRNVVIATKFGLSMTDDTGGPLVGDGSRRYIMNAVEGSLKRLGTDYIDLYQIHFPDPVTPLEETLDTLATLIQQGKVRYVGGCNYRGWQLAEVQLTARAMSVPGFSSMQNFYNILRRDVEDERLPSAQRFGVGFLPYFPLASGLLTGKYKRNKKPEKDTRLGSSAALACMEMTERNFDLVEALENFASERSLTLLEVAVGWLLAQPGVACVMAGATNPCQVQQNAAASDRVLSADDVAELNEMTRSTTGLPF